jgi:hypothetical protein
MNWRDWIGDLIGAIAVFAIPYALLILGHAFGLN